MRPSTLIKSLTSLIPTGQPVYLWGPPGCGKSSVVREACAKLARPFVDVRAVLLDPVDLRGIPSVSAGRTTWNPPDFLPREGEGVLLLDELAQSPPLVQAALLQLTLDRRIGEYALPDGWSIVAASNRQEDRAGGHRLITPLLNRFVHLDLEADHDDWHAWAAGSGVATEVRSFLRYKPDCLFNFDPSAGERAFCTPRSWEFVSKVLPATDAETLMPLVAGCVGQGAAGEFAAFVEIYRSLPDVDKILASPMAGVVPTEPSVVYALAGALAAKARGADKPKLGNIAKYAGRLPTEFGILLMRDAAAANRQIVAVPDGQAFIRKHKDLLIGSGD